MNDYQQILERAHKWRSDKCLRYNLSAARRHDAEAYHILTQLLAALDAARGEARQKVKDTLTDYLDHYPHPELLDAVMAQFVTAAPPAAAVPPGGLRDSVLNSAKFRASCYALVGIVEGIAGLGRRRASDGERLKDTPEWVAFYNCVASMRNGTFNQASAEQAQQPAAPANVRTAWAEGYRAGVMDERTSEASIGIAGFGAKIEPARENPYATQAQCDLLIAAVPEPMPPVPDSMGLSREQREQREVEDAFRRGWNSCRARVMQLNAYALAVRNKENNNE